MSRKMDRRGFLKALPFIPAATVEEIKEPSSPPEEELNIIRPPYSDEESDFSKCAECGGSCITACEERLLFRLQDGSPQLVFSDKGCTFCKKCAEACEFDVLSTQKPERIYALFKINISKCVSWQNVMCFSCKDPCIDNAIKFDGIFRPQIIPDVCTGCGFCIPVCPSGAIEVFPLEREREENEENTA
ncbi:ferredoxin-type protein NapF [Persephonella sp.]